MLELALAIFVQHPHVTWDDFPNQPWTGSHWHANRLQDWEIQNKKVQCLETGKNLPMRTLHYLPADIDGDFELYLDTGTIDQHAELTQNSWPGLIIGAGNQSVNKKLTALTHHVPAEDGGVVAGINHKGMVFIRSNAQPVGGTALWSINTEIKPTDLPLIQPISKEGNGFSSNLMKPVRLRIEQNGNYLELEATEIGTEKIVSKATYDARKIDTNGSVAIVSHHGPKKSTKGYWFDNFKLNGKGVRHVPDMHFGPVLCALYTVSNHVLKITAQFPPLDKSRNAVFQYKNHLITEAIDTDSWTATFTLENWHATTDIPYTMYLEDNSQGYDGIIRAEPSKNKPIKIAALTCHKTYTGNLKWNENGLWFPHEDTVAAIQAANPDLLYFSGDQIYEGDLTPARQKNEDAYLLDYLYKWSHWCWAFQELTRSRPCVTIPDDHDVYHGNLWGAGERDAQKVEGLSAQDSGGYRMSPRFVNAVHRTQTGHLPNPIDPSLDAQGNTVYYTRLQYGGLDIAILGDRQFKESPAIAVPDGGVYNGWFKAEGFEPENDADCEAPLLGSRQEDFLSHWAEDWSNKSWTKLVFSQTPFVCLQTLPTGTFGGGQAGLTIYPQDTLAPNDSPVADADSNGWPQTARNRTLKIIKKANATHICGDQHLGYVAQYGIEEHKDGTFVFCTPAIANTWPRRWMPKDKEITGPHKDGFGNLVTVLAVSNPHLYNHEPTALHDRAPGWGMIICDPETENITIEAWPRSAGPNANEEKQYTGWPITIHNAGKSGVQ